MVSIVPAEAQDLTRAAGLDLPLWEVRQWHDFPISIHLNDRQSLQRLLADVPLGEFDREGLSPSDAGWLLTIRVTPAEALSLTKAGWSFERLTDHEKSGRQEVEQSWANGSFSLPPLERFNKSDAAAIDYYPTHAQLGTLLENLATTYPAICRTFSWGQSVQGRQLWGLVISADVNNTSAEPEVRLSSTMHGNEVVGMVMLMNLAHHLVQNYDQAGYDDLTALVNSTEIHLMVLHNPDG